MLRWRTEAPLCLLIKRNLRSKQDDCTAALHYHRAETNHEDRVEASQIACHSSTLTIKSDLNGASPCESWREWLPIEQLQRIDTLIYLLGRYPRPEATDPTVSEEEGVRICKYAGSEVKSNFAKAKVSPAALPSSPSPLRSKRAKLAVLNARAVPSRAKKSVAAPKRTLCVPSSSSTAQANAPPTTIQNTIQDVNTSQQSPSASPASRLWAIKPLMSSSTPIVVKGPHTPVDVVEQLARQWLRKERRVHAKISKADAVAEAAWQALLQHPPHLFADETAVYSRFGMGGHVSPTIPGFTGLFRQRWQDFHVTEMFTSPDSCAAGEGGNHTQLSASIGTNGLYCNGTPVSRAFDFRIPALPSELLSDGSEPADGRGDEKEADLSFFAVDVKQRIHELRAEEVRDKDLAAAAEVLAKEQRKGRVLPVVSATESTRDAEITSSVSPKMQSDNAAAAAATAVSLDATRVSRASATDVHRSVQYECINAATTNNRRNFLQCTLHKQHIAHGNALATIAQTLRIHPRSISVAGIKDFIGDTVQRVRLEHVSPAAALAANRRFRQKRLRMTLSDFSYESGPLSPGDLFGNHFKVVLRDVDVPKNSLADAIAAFTERGFPNYYGCQRFSWFAGRQDAAFALLRHNWLAFAFLFLNFTGKDRSLRELLQRPNKYPHPAQDEYRRGIVRRLRQIAVEPTDLDVAPFLSCPSLNAPLTHMDGRPFSEVQELICMQLREAYFDLNVQSRRLTAQRLSSYLWNQVLTLRLHHVGGTQVLDGDLVAPASVRQLSVDTDDRQDWYHTFGDRVSAENRHRYAIDDVVHPGFSFDAITLPDNVIGAYYQQVCSKYGLDWMAQHSRSGLRDFREPPRPIIRKPLNLSYEYNAEAHILTLRFALERGCYANVALSELMKSVRCLGVEEVTLLPLPDALWGALGEEDPGHVTTLQDIYEGYEDGVGFMNEEASVERASESETKAWDHQGALFLPSSEDPYRKAHRWGSQHLLRNSERREKETEDMKRMLFDYPLAKKLREGEVDTYAGHIVPLPPNASAKRVYAKVMQRKRRYAGSPKMVTRMQRSTSPSSHRHGVHGASKLPSFQSLNKNSWNFSW